MRLCGAAFRVRTLTFTRNRSSSGLSTFAAAQRTAIREFSEPSTATTAWREGVVVSIFCAEWVQLLMVAKFLDFHWRTLQERSVPGRTMTRALKTLKEKCVLFDVRPLTAHTLCKDMHFVHVPF